MMPAYRSMDSYPYQRNQTPFHHCYHPRVEAIPPQMKMDPSKPPFSLDQHWPYAGSCGHPMPPHFCCGHNYHPGYYSYRPSYPYAPAPIYYSGGSPTTYGEPYAVSCSLQPHYTMELPRYEYDKYMPHDRHCCGCPNHPCNQKEDKSVKIEEHEPDGGKKGTDALVPIQFKNYPYPLIWVPPEYTYNKQLKSPSMAERAEQDKISQERKPPSPENFNADPQPTQEPRVWNGWLPFDIKGAPNKFHSGDGIRNQNREIGNNGRESDDGKMDLKHQSEHKRSEFPFPIFWLPYCNKQEESGKTNNQEETSSPKIIEEVPHTFKSVPVKSHVDEGVMNGTGSNQVESTNTGALDDAKKLTSARSIPVKQIELHQGKNDSEESDKVEINVSPSQVQESVTQKDSCPGDKKRESLSPPKAKASKLPPVCLRVDPLPRKKNGSGRSRSLSPPSSEEIFQAMTGETSKTPSLCMNRDKAQSNYDLQNAAYTSQKVEPKVRTIQVCENKTSENKSADCKDGSQNQIGANIPSEVPISTKETCIDGNKCKIEDEKAEKVSENMMEETTEQKEVKDSNAPTDKGQKEKEGRVLSNADAAVLIQAAYRGHQVRKWEWLKKLKQIDEVNKEVTNVRGRVQAFESSSDLQNDDKQKIAIGETIMRLLLKLDTIQGLHPSLREIRKSLARELTTLQEGLDFIVAKKPQQQMHDLVVEKPVEVTPQNMQNEEYVQEQQKEKVDISRDSCEGISDGVKSPGASDGGIETRTPVDAASSEGMETIVPSHDDALNSISDISKPNEMPVELQVKSEVNHIPIEVDKLDMTIWEELPVGVLDEDINNVSTTKDEHVEFSAESLHTLDSEIHSMTELPVGLVDENDETNNSKGKAQAENREWIEELPVRLLDEDAAKSEVETHEKVLPTEERVCNADKKTNPSVDDTAIETQLEHPQEEEREEVRSFGEPDGWVKIEFQNEDEVKEHTPSEVAENDTKLPSLTIQVSDHQLGKRDACLEAKDVNSMLPERMESAPINNLQKGQEEEVKVVQPEKTEQSEASHPLQELEVAVGEYEYDGGLNGHAKLLEENDRLRKMMNKLLEAGNEQLSVISDLTGRVKELEKKLARSRTKKVKAKRYRSTTSKTSAMKSSK
ncbi:hypothetical protein VNO77_06856 [Canavalia gladiata]|uniref:BAG domain-containing protein n=1 Tax=Canavalia gladiata TaxID=3824 RepID=A0AAN9MCR3_CANGL